MDESPLAQAKPPKDLLAALWFHRFRLLLVAIVGAVAGFAYTSVVPPEYEATCVYVFPVATPTSPLAAALSSGGATPLTVLKGILKSPPINNALGKEYKLDPDDVNLMVGVLERTEENQIVVTLPTKDKQWGVRFLNSLVRHVDKLSNQVGFSMAQRQFDAIQENLTKRESDLRTAENQLVAYLKTTKTAPSSAGTTATEFASQYIDTIKQLQAVENELSSRKSKAMLRSDEANRLLPHGDGPLGQTLQEKLRQEVLTLQGQLSERREVLGPDAPEIADLENKLRVANQALIAETRRQAEARLRNVDATVMELEIRRRTLEAGKQQLESLRKLAPDEQLNFNRMSREVAVLTAAVQSLRQQLETARVNASVEQVRWSLLQPPYAEAKPTNKGIVRMPAMFMLLAVGVYATFVFFGLLVRERTSGV